MVKVRILRGVEYVDITLQEMCNLYHKEAPRGWFDTIKDIIDNAMSVSTTQEEDAYYARCNFCKIDFKGLRKFYEVLMLSKYSNMFDDDILKYIAYIQQCHFFEKINYPIDVANPNLDEWLNAKSPFSSNFAKAQFKEDESYSIMDLLPLENGMNAIRSLMLSAEKWIY